MRKIRTVLAAVIAALVAVNLVTACGRSGGDATKPLVVVADATPHTELIKEAQRLGLLGDVKIELKPITGEIDVNQLVESGDVDANFFQHQPYLDSWLKEKGVNDLVSVASVHVEPLGLYSKKITTLAEVPSGSTVAIPSDPSNQARALFLLQDAKLLTLDVSPGDADLDYTQISTKNITGNPKNLTFLPIDRPQLAATLDDAKVTLSIINGNYALEAGLKPAKDALALESAENNPYANLLVVKESLKDDPRVKKLAEALTSPQLAQFISDTYSGSVLPASK